MNRKKPFDSLISVFSFFAFVDLCVNGNLPHWLIESFCRIGKFHFGVDLRMTFHPFASTQPIFADIFCQFRILRVIHDIQMIDIVFGTGNVLIFC